MFYIEKKIGFVRVLISGIRIFFSNFRRRSRVFQTPVIQLDNSSDDEPFVECCQVGREVIL